MDNYKVLNVRKYKVGYEIRTLLIPENEHGNSHAYEVKWAFTPSGDFIGTSREAHKLVSTLGIAPQKRLTSHSGCSIGFSNRNKKWYGWSHRALFGFEIGHVTKEGDVTTGSVWTEEHLAEYPEDATSMLVGFEAKTLEDCKRLAQAFAGAI